MRKVFSISLLALYLISTTELYQLLKIPILIEHYIEKKVSSPELTLSDFLSNHYLEDHLRDHPFDDDYQQDQRLPFMMTSSIFTPVFTSQHLFFIEIKSLLYAVNLQKKPLTNDRFSDNVYLASIWQPPRVC